MKDGEMENLTIRGIAVSLRLLQPTSVSAHVLPQSRSSKRGFNYPERNTLKLVLIIKVDGTGRARKATAVAR